MAHLTMRELSGLGSSTYVKVARGRAFTVTRPPAHGSLSGLGQSSECGPEPGLGPNEKKVCCPNLGWVIYDSTESSYGICERAAAGGGGGGGGSSAAASGSSAPSSDPFARVEEMRRALDERRAQREEDEFERKKAEMQLRFVMGQMQAVQAQEAAKAKAKRDSELAMARAKAAAEEARLKKEQNKKLAILGGIGLVAAKVLGVF